MHAEFGASHFGLLERDPLSSLQLMAESVVPGGVAVVCRDVKGDVGALFAEERRAICNAVPRRQAEFAAGRMAARRALGELGQAPVALAVGADRAPVWPLGYRGSISHCRTAAVAVAARADAALGFIGIDIEEAVPLERELWDAICTSSEIEWLEAHWSARLWAKIVFSIKEAVYKAQYPVTGRMLEFQEVELTFGQGHSFRARLLPDTHVAVDGRFAVNERYIFSCATARLPSAPF
jgi:4'-phosphopantetheinyl transferase EntD